MALGRIEHGPPQAGHVVEEGRPGNAAVMDIGHRRLGGLGEGRGVAVPQPAAYPNGRVLTDDVYSLRFAWLSNGKIPPAASSPTTTSKPSSPTSESPTPNREVNYEPSL